LSQRLFLIEQYTRKSVPLCLRSRSAAGDADGEADTGVSRKMVKRIEGPKKGIEWDPIPPARRRAILVADEPFLREFVVTRIRHAHQRDGRYPADLYRRPGPCSGGGSLCVTMATPSAWMETGS
jgi:hypothetical protein